MSQNVFNKPGAAGGLVVLIEVVALGYVCKMLASASGISEWFALIPCIIFLALTIFLPWLSAGLISVFIGWFIFDGIYESVFTIEAVVWTLVGALIAGAIQLGSALMLKD